MSDAQPFLRLAIDGNEANATQRVGSNVYAFEVLREIAGLVTARGIQTTVLLSSPPQAHWPAERQDWRYVTVPPAKYWTQWAAPIYLRKHRSEFDLFFTPGHYAPRHCPLPYVSSVMDTAYLEYPHEFKLKDRLQLTNWTEYSVKNAAAIATISRFSKKCVCDAYQRVGKDVVVAYPAVQPPPKLNAQAARSLLTQLSIDAPYFLYLGTIQPRKRIHIIVEAFEMLCKQLLEEKKQYRSKSQTIRQLPQLVIAGKVGWLAESVVERCQRSPFAKQIVLTGFVSDEQKAALLSESTAVAMVGRHEGFGIPALEAMQAGTIPIVARTGSLPEVVGAAGLVVAADNQLQLCNKFDQVLRLSSRERKMYVARGKEQARQFSWQASAEIILDALENVAAGQPVST